MFCFSECSELNYRYSFTVRLNIIIGKPMKYFLLLIVLCPSYLFSQISPDTLHMFKSHDYPTVYGTHDDNYPDSFISGLIKDVSFGVSCGVICGSGTIKVKLSKLPDYFPSPNVFVVIPCLSAGDKKGFINKKVSLRVTKLLRNNDRCYFMNVSNSIISDNQPFYYYDNDRYGPFIIKSE